MKHYKEKFLAIGLLLLFTAQSCNQEENLTYGDFDLNNDYLVEMNEFKKVFTTHYYNEWDSNNDQALDDEDFFVTVYDIWDTNEDEKLTKEEYIMGFDYHYGNYIVEDFAVIDANDDGVLAYSEFYDALYPSKFYEDWNLDDDDMLSENELAENVFKRWDYDNSGSIDLDEFSDFDSYYLEI